jgi:hypothetical protein
MSYALITSIALLTVAQAQPDTQRALAPAAEILLEPTRVRLDFDNRTLAEIADGLSAQGASPVVVPSDSAVRIGGELPKPSPPPRRFHVHEPGAVTFWEAIDRVCRATSSWAWVETPRAPVGPATVPRVVLAPASADRGFVCNDGAFRIVVYSLFYARDIVLAPPFLPAHEPAGRGAPSDNATFAADLFIMAEPRLRIQQFGNLKIRQAIDDKGHDLVRASPIRQPSKVQDGVISHDGASVWLSVTLHYPVDPGTLIKRLSGSVSAQVSARAAGAHSVATELAFDFAAVPMP